MSVEIVSIRSVKLPARAVTSSLDTTKPKATSINDSVVNAPLIVRETLSLFTDDHTSQLYKFFIFSSYFFLKINIG